MHKSYYIYIDEHTTCEKKRACAYVGGIWMVEECNGDWKPFPSSEFVIYEDV